MQKSSAVTNPLAATRGLLGMLTIRRLVLQAFRPKHCGKISPPHTVVPVTTARSEPSLKCRGQPCLARNPGVRRGLGLAAPNLPGLPTVGSPMTGALCGFPPPNREGIRSFHAHKRIHPVLPAGSARLRGVLGCLERRFAVHWDLASRSSYRSPTMSRRGKGVASSLVNGSGHRIAELSCPPALTKAPKPAQCPAETAHWASSNDLSANLRTAQGVSR